MVKVNPGARGAPFQQCPYVGEVDLKRCLARLDVRDELDPDQDVLVAHRAEVFGVNA